MISKDDQEYLLRLLRVDAERIALRRERYNATYGGGESDLRAMNALLEANIALRDWVGSLQVSDDGT